MYADWVRHVFLVTDDQVPAWLDTDQPAAHRRDHRELFGARGRLPTFNSHAIESQLHHLDGLAENYLYLNDDVFFGRPVAPEPVRPRQRPGRSSSSPTSRSGSGPVRRRATCRSPAPPRTTATCCSRSSAGPRCQQVPARAVLAAPLGHARPRGPLRRRTSSATASSQFRSPTDISVSAVPRAGVQLPRRQGRARPAPLPLRRHRPRPTPRTGWPSCSPDRDHDVFCLNDHDSSTIDPVVQAQIMNEFLSAYFPQPSSFELA